jgi:phosphomevalonate kinase
MILLINKEKIKNKIYTHIIIILHIFFLYIYIRLKIKPNSVRIRFYSCQIFVLPSTGFEPTPVIHCSLTSSALDHSTTTTYHIHTVFNLYQQYRHNMAVPSVTNAQGHVSVIQMQWSPEAGAKGTFDQADHSTH